MAHLGKINPAALKRPKKKTAAQLQAGRHLELYGIVHFLLTEQRCPVIFEGKLAYVRCPGVSKAAFKKAIDDKVIRNCLAYVKDHTPEPTPSTNFKKWKAREIERLMEKED